MWKHEEQRYNYIQQAQRDNYAKAKSSDAGAVAAFERRANENRAK
jgi:hypothetical protein